MHDIGTLEWLKQNALFSCHIDSCREEISYDADNLALTPDGLPVCEGCWDYGEERGRYANLGYVDAEGDALGFHELRPFRPFAALAEKGQRDE